VRRWAPPAQVNDRAGQVTWAELEVPTAAGGAGTSRLLDGRRPAPHGVTRWGVLSSGGTTSRTSAVTWAELEVPTADATARVTWAEVAIDEIPRAPRHPHALGGDLDVIRWGPTGGRYPSDRIARVTWAEMDVPVDSRAAWVTWAEGEVPTASRTARVCWTEVEIPGTPAAARIPWAELAMPDAPRAAQILWAEMASDEADRAARVLLAAVEVPAHPMRRSGDPGGAFRRRGV
jgi:hypothetical protein